MSKHTFQEFQKICLPPEILNRPVDRQYLLLYMRKISIRISWLLHNISWLTPNMVTVSMIILGPVASALLLIPGIWGIIAFFLAHQFWGIIDRVDGELARYTKIFSPAGLYLDTIAHILIHAALFVALGWKFYLISANATYLYLGLASALIMTVNWAIFHAGKFYALYHHIPYEEDLATYNRIPPLLIIIREIKAAMIDHNEISIFGSIALIIYLYFLPSPFIPLILLVGYLILIVGGVFWVIKNRYLSLVKKLTSKI